MSSSAGDGAVAVVFPTTRWCQISRFIPCPDSCFVLHVISSALIYMRVNSVAHCAVIEMLGYTFYTVKNVQ